MKKTSRLTFGKQLAVAIATLSVIAFSTSTALSQQTNTQTESSKDCERKEHDTPPPTVLMSGSWIFEARTEKNHDWSVTSNRMIEGGRKEYTHKVPAYDGCGKPAKKDIFIAHVKIVDGSGEMLYRLDNDKKERIEIRTFMSSDKKESVTLKVYEKDFLITFFENRKLEKEEPSMDPEGDPKKKRQRALYKDTGGSKDHPEIYGIEVSQADYTVYGKKLYGHKALKELRIMIWWEEK